MPPTRYQGSKRKIAEWIADQVATLRFDSVLDAFGGSGAVAYAFKRRGKCVTYNDVLRFNHAIGTALIENSATQLDDEDLERMLRRDPRRRYDDFIARTFSGIYFTDDENRWLDVVAQNLTIETDRYRRALGYYALFQAALAKRPYNLFHRRNLYMRTARVCRGFGNKTTWDRSFAAHFRARAADGNAAVFDNGRRCTAWCADASALSPGFDLVYIDPPYVNDRAVGVDYHAFYHFLEGLIDYGAWPQHIDRSSKHRRLRPVDSPWVSARTNADAFRALFARHRDAILLVSYRDDGLPSVPDLTEMLGEFKRRVRIESPGRYQYALSTNRRSREVLLIGTNQ